MSRFSALTIMLLASLVMSLSVQAYSTPPPVSSGASSESSQQASRASSHARGVIKPGARDCLRDTGSLIHARNGECAPVNGRSYSGDELRSTGASNNARALQMLDPSISVRGH